MFIQIEALMEKMSRFLIHFWMAVGIATLVYAFFRIGINGWEKEAENLVIPAIAFTMWYFRRKLYQRMQKRQNDH
jgi:hypothetical protein